MPCVVEVDQSGKVEDTAKDTVLALANDKAYSVVIPASVKRRLLQELRQRGIGAKERVMRVFAVGLYFLLRDHLKELSEICIDDEYTGRGVEIKRYLVNALLRAGYTVDSDAIYFTFVGKKSPAHELASLVLRGKERSNKVVTFDEMAAELASRRERRKSRQ